MSLHDPAGTHTAQSHGEAAQVFAILGGIFKFYSDQKRFCPRNESLSLKPFKTRALNLNPPTLLCQLNLPEHSSYLITCSKDHQRFPHVPLN